MRPLAFSPDSLRTLLLHDKIATLPDLKRALGTDVDLTVFRKLKELDYLTSYSHGGRFYTLREIARFGADGLWSLAASGSPATVPCWPPPRRSSIVPAGYFAEELSAPCTSERKMSYATLSSKEDRPGVRLRPVPLYFHRSSHPPATILTRRSNQSVPTVVDATRSGVSPDEMKAAIILFYSLLDEQQRRLYAGLESMKLGHGGDSVLAEFPGPRSAHHRPRPPPVAGSGC